MSRLYKINLSFNMRPILMIMLTFVGFFMASGTIFARQNICQISDEETILTRKQELRKLATADRQKMLDKLKIVLPHLASEKDDKTKPEGLTQREGSDKWYDANRNMYIRSSWGKWTNYDESKANNFKLPDPLLLNNVKKVETEKSWWRKRRPEILSLFENEIYGRIPKRTPKVDFELVSSSISNNIICKKLIGHIDNSSYSKANPGINLRIYIPAEASAKIPLVVIAIGNYGNTDTLVVNKILKNNWACATVETDSIQMDSGAGLHEGIIGLVDKGPDRKPNAWGTISAWAWGLSRTMDYLQTDPSFDHSKIMLQGHSRWGKLALWAGALDSRWSAVYASCSGAGGAALGMRDYAENIDNIADVNLYHWMAGNFLKYGGNWEKLPVDSHELIALIAPRPVFIGSGTKDQWTDPNGQFMACVAADPVYNLLNKKGLETDKMPKPDVSLIKGNIGFRNHEGGHSDRTDWDTFFEFIKNNIAF